MDNFETWVTGLLAEMTPEEKAGQLTQYFYFTMPADMSPPGFDFEAMRQRVEGAMAKGRVGSALFLTKPGQINRLQRLTIQGNRLGIPALFGFDVIHGLRTILPVPIAMAASWDPDTVEAAQTVAAREARAVGIHWTFAPMVDIARDPRWGRMIEGAGEDPYLGAAMAAAQVRGFQGAGVGSPERIIAGPKHFAGYGASLGGRDYDEVNVSDSEFYNVHLPPFAAAIEAGAGNIMTAYMDLNGIPASGNRWLLTDVLRGELGFKGFVVTDANAANNLATQHFAANAADAGARALDAGVDLEMSFVAAAFENLPAALASGAASSARLDESVRRMLRTKLELGLFEHPYVDEARAAEVLADPAHRDVSQRAAERSTVLLKNAGGALPLNLASLKSIAVIGPLADSKRDTLGPWVFDFDLDETVTVLAGIRAYAGDKAEVSYARGIKAPMRLHPSMFDIFPGNAPSDPDGFDEAAEFQLAVATAAKADVTIIVLGESQNMIGEAASRSSLELPGRQLELLQAVVATGKPVVLLVMNGRPLDLRWAAEHVPAILDIWYPGSRGGAAAARLLFGDVSPGGKLPFTWPRTAGQIPLIYSHTTSHQPAEQTRRYWDLPGTPLFSFGHGLSYGAFEYTNLQVSSESIDRDAVVTVSVEVTNRGARAADEVAQLYLHQRHGQASRPVRELKGFRRISLEAGQKATVTFSLGPKERRYWNAAVRGWINEATSFDVWVGGDCNAALAGSFTVS